MIQLSLLDRAWIELYAPVVVSAFRGKGEFTTDDLHGILPEPEQVNHMGALMARLRNCGLIVKTGYQPSKRPSANGRVLATWMVKDSTPA